VVRELASSAVAVADLEQVDAERVVREEVREDFLANVADYEARVEKLRTRESLVPVAIRDAAAQREQIALLRRHGVEPLFLISPHGYATDPGGTLVEFCTTTGVFSEADRALALKAVTSDEIERADPPAKIEVHKAEKPPAHLRDREAA